MKRYVLLDRDGTIIYERHYLSNPNALTLFPNAIIGMRKLKEMGLGLVLVTNQSGIGRGYFSEETLATIHDHLELMLEGYGIQLDAIFYCPHHPQDNCTCRKPEADMAQRAATLLNFDLNQAFVIGDKGSDTEMGLRVGATSFLVKTGYGEAHLETAQYNYAVNNLVEAATIIQKLINQKAKQKE